MEITKFMFPPEKMRALAKEVRSAFLLIGLFLNDVTWLQKLMLTGMSGGKEIEPEEKAQLGLKLLLLKILAAKINEGWNKIRLGEISDVVSSLDMTPEAESLKDQLEEKLKKDSLIHKVRRSHGSHYPNHLSLDGLENLTETECSIYLTTNIGDSYSLISELAAISEMNNVVAGIDQDFSSAFTSAVEEIIAVAGIYCAFLSEISSLIVDQKFDADHEREIFSIDVRTGIKPSVRYFSIE